MSRQYVAVEFKRGSRQYTYHNDGPPLGTGDVVRVPTRHGTQAATVFGEVDQPEFETKPILEKIEDGGLLNSTGDDQSK